MSEPIRDHNGSVVRHAKETVNGVRLHYVIAGAGDPVVLLHGIPKTLYHWRKVIPLLTPHYTVIAPDLRGFGDSEHPKTGAYDTRTIAEDIAQLVSAVGFSRFRVVGEDWGAATAYTLAAAHPERVQQLVYAEMLLPGLGWEKGAHETRGKMPFARWDTRTLWHLNFYTVPDFPELLITGRERQYFDFFIKNETLDPAAVTDDAIDEYVRCYSTPGSLRAMFELYRTSGEDAEQNQEFFKQKLTMPVLAVGARHFFAEEVQHQMEQVAENVRFVMLEWGHQLAEECPEELVRELLAFFRE